MGACCGSAKVQQTGFKPEITEGRKCTDVLCLIIFILFWIGMFVVASVGYNSGDPSKYEEIINVFVFILLHRLIFATDYAGNTCGSKSNKCNGPCSSKLAIVYPRTNEDLMVAAQSGAVTKIELFGICTSQCPKKRDWVCTYEMEDRLSQEGLASPLREAELERCKAKAAALGAASVFASRLLVTDPICRSRLENCWQIGQDHSESEFLCSL